jgi:NAD(P)-dependent dehydrogenase (short-subunit alcohol dehydrogenase family)
MPGRLEGKRALILGGGSGLGRACAEAMAQEGAAVLIAGRRAGKLADVAAKWPGRIHHAAGDATQEGDMERIVAAAVQAMGGLDTLVVSSGVSVIGSTLNTTVEQFHQVMDTNLLPLLLGARLGAPHIAAAGGGAIIAFASVVAAVGMRERLSYVTSKAAVLGMVKAMALDLADRAIRVNAISPSLVLTELAQEIMSREKDPDAVLARRKAAHPLGRLGTPEEIAEVAVYLASDRAGWTTGQDFVIDGGLTLG